MIKEKIIPFGETHNGYVIEGSKSVIYFYATDNREAYVLLGHGIKDFPVKNTKGKIVFEKGGPKGGYWHFYFNN